MRYFLTLESIFPVVKPCCCETGFHNTHPLTTIPLPVFDTQTRSFIHHCRNAKREDGKVVACRANVRVSFKYKGN